MSRPTSTCVTSASLVGMLVLDRVFDRQDLEVVGFVEEIDEGGQCRALAAPGSAAHQCQTAPRQRNLAEYRRQVQLLERPDPGHDDAEHQARASQVAVQVAAEPGVAGRTMREVGTAGHRRVDVLDDGPRCDGLDELADLRVSQGRDLDRAHLAQNPHQGQCAGLEMKVRGTLVHGELEELVDGHRVCLGFSAPPRRPFRERSDLLLQRFQHLVDFPIESGSLFVEHFLERRDLLLERLFHRGGLLVEDDGDRHEQDRQERSRGLSDGGPHLGPARGPVVDGVEWDQEIGQAVPEALLERERDQIGDPCAEHADVRRDNSQGAKVQQDLHLEKVADQDRHQEEDRDNIEPVAEHPELSSEETGSEGRQQPPERRRAGGRV